MQKEDDITSLALGVNNTRGLRTFELWEERLADDGKYVERVALFVFEERHNLEPLFRRTNRVAHRGYIHVNKATVQGENDTEIRRWEIDFWGQHGEFLGNLEDLHLCSE